MSRFMFPHATALVALLATTTLAQNAAVVDYSQLPACANTCSTLKSAEAQCVPPTAAVTSQNAYQACFCASPSLTGLYANPDAICTDVCTSASDRATIKNYYVNLCTSGIVVTPGATSAQAQATTTSSESATTTATDAAVAAQATANNPSQGGASDPNANTDHWFAHHWQYVLMLIIIFLAMIFFSILGVWLKRRHNRKKDVEKANVAAREGKNEKRPASSGDQPGTSRSNPAVMTGAAVPPMESVSSVGIAPPRPPHRAMTRDRANTANSNINQNAWVPYPLMTSGGAEAGPSRENGYDSPVDGPESAQASYTTLPDEGRTGPRTYSGAHDLPDRTYSPVIVTKRSSTNLSDLNTASAGGSGHLPLRGPPSPVLRPTSPPYDQNQQYTGIGAQRLQAMRSAERMRFMGPGNAGKSPMSTVSAFAEQERRSNHSPAWSFGSEDSGETDNRLPARTTSRKLVKRNSGRGYGFHPE